MSPRGKYRTLPLKEKLAAIQEVDAGVKKTEVALKYGITKSTLTTILKAKDKLHNNASRFAPDRKRLREAAYPDLENAVLLWLKRARSSNLPINGPILREKAEELSLRLGIEDFKCSDGWISPFKERHGLFFKTTEGDDESQVLSALKAHNIAADLDSYAATDDDLCVCREDTLDDLVAEVLPAQHSSESEEEPEVENVTTAQAFQYIAKGFKSRHDVVGRVICGESASADSDASASWVAEKLPGILDRYEAADLYNAGEMALFYQMFPNCMLELKGDAMSTEEMSDVALVETAQDRDDGKARQQQAELAQQEWTQMQLVAQQQLQLQQSQVEDDDEY
ncbi:hypothetical protein HPB51_021880 [Rhipicephalus microplus]|uniref:Tick transposon n=1 Tax=Rhipicephalus microplus TaxID=6941 RepID=A0A9J6EIQ7_RHIMP|nr:hypothetical protein HPB51_021880 [Rhipicephalus microplus]